MSETRTIKQIDAALDRAWGRLWFYKLNADMPSVRVQQQVVDRLLDERLCAMRETEGEA